MILRKVQFTLLLASVAIPAVSQKIITEKQIAEDQLWKGDETISVRKFDYVEAPGKGYIRYMDNQIQFIDANKLEISWQLAVPRMKTGSLVTVVLVESDRFYFLQSEAAYDGVKSMNISSVDYSGTLIKTITQSFEKGSGGIERAFTLANKLYIHHTMGKKRRPAFTVIDGTSLDMVKQQGIGTIDDPRWRYPEVEEGQIIMLTSYFLDAEGKSTRVGPDAVELRNERLILDSELNEVDRQTLKEPYSVSGTLRYTSFEAPEFEILVKDDNSDKDLIGKSLMWASSAWIKRNGSDLYGQSGLMGKTSDFGIRLKHKSLTSEDLGKQLKSLTGTTQAHFDIRSLAIWPMQATDEFLVMSTSIKDNGNSVARLTTNMGVLNKDLKVSAFFNIQPNLPWQMFGNKMQFQPRNASNYVKSSSASFNGMSVPYMVDHKGDSIFTLFDYPDKQVVFIDDPDKKTTKAVVVEL